MALSQRTFLIRLYEEYLEEASFLYGQRSTLFGNPEILWGKIGEFEERMGAHLDGLTVGGGLALEVCARHTEEADSGELFAALCVFCRQDERDLAFAALERLDPGDAQKARAAADALKYEMPDTWAADLLLLLERGDPKFAPVLAPAFGYRRVNCGMQLAEALHRCAAAALPQVVWALGRVGHKLAVGPLLELLKSEDAPVRSAAALALARMGERKAVDYCLGEARTASWAILPLGVAGGREAVPLLGELAREGSPEGLTALGLLGDPECASLLLSRLEQAETAVAAAAALECLTGAGLLETVFIPDEMSEDELFDSERAARREGKPPDRGDGRPFGSKVTRVAQNARCWNDWWSANGRRFAPGVRYRGGAPLSPVRLVRMLAAPDTPHPVRRFCGEELSTRYGEDFGFEPDMPAARQSRLLSEAVGRAGLGIGSFTEGGWYFGGRRID